MSDDDRIFEDDDQEGIDDVEVGKKVGILPAIVIKILQIAAISIIGIVLVITIAVVTYNILSKGQTGQSPQIVSPAFSDKKELYDFFNVIEQVRGQTKDNPPKTFMAKISIGYQVGNKIIQTELNERVEELQNLMLKYLSSKSGDELSSTRYEFLEEDLKRRINNLMIEKIDKVLFTELQVF